MAEVKDNILNKFESNQEEAVIDTSKKLRIGIIGTGGIAHAHMQAYQKQPDVEIIALADIEPGKAAAFAKEFGLENVACYEGENAHHALLENEKLDAVSICTYNRTHALCAIDALRHGLPVLLEKPMCVTMDEARAIMNAEKESGKFVSVGFQPRFDDNMKMIKKIVDSGELGEIYYIQTGGGRRHGIPTPFGTSFIQDDTAGLGALGDIGCYSLDMVLNAIGYPKPLTVTGYKSDFFGKNPATYIRTGRPAEYADIFSVDDFAAAFIRLEGGIILDFRIAWDMHVNTPGDTIIFGKKGALRIPSTECWNGSTGGPMTIYHDVAGEPVETVIPEFPEDTNHSNFYKKCRSFLNAIKTDGKAPIPSSQIIINQAIIDAIAKSADLGHEIEVTIPEI